MEALFLALPAKDPKDTAYLANFRLAKKSRGIEIVAIRANKKDGRYY